MKSLARRVKELTAEHQALVKALDSVVSLHNPGLRAAHRVGPDTAAQLLVTAGGLTWYYALILEWHGRLRTVSTTCAT
ncbi:hypothetical protein GCM10010244_21330 [Streptomyces coeruleorubidus]|nr:hypothetical protein GCM10010244_21330 [Streptomyces bellus]